MPSDLLHWPVADIRCEINSQQKGARLGSGARLGIPHDRDNVTHSSTCMHKRRKFSRLLVSLYKFISGRIDDILGDGHQVIG